MSKFSKLGNRVGWLGVRREESSGIVYIRARNMGIRQIMQEFFNGLKSPFCDQNVKVYLPSWHMRYQGSSAPGIKGGARFEEAVHDVREED